MYNIILDFDYQLRISSILNINTSILHLQKISDENTY